MSAREHELKTWPEPFQAVLDQRKKFEIHVDDRDFQINDLLILREWQPRQHGVRPQAIGLDGSPGYTGREIRARVTYLVPGGRWGLPENLCVMSIFVESSS